MYTILTEGKSRQDDFVLASEQVYVRSCYIPVELNAKYDFLGRYAYTYILCMQLLYTHLVKRYYSAWRYREIEQIIQNDVANRPELTTEQLDSTYSSVTSVINFCIV